MRYAQTALDAIQHHVDPLVVVGRYVTLTKTGTGRCPFHDDQSPSFNVNPETGLWHCHAGCGSGNVFQFLQRAEQITFPQAVQRLAAEAGIALADQDLAADDAHQHFLREQWAAQVERLDGICRQMEAEVADVLRTRWPKLWPPVPMDRLGSLSQEEKQRLDQAERIHAAFDNLARISELRRWHVKELRNALNG